MSKSTVSRVLNSQPGVAPVARARVLEAVAELGYRPNQLARSLRTERTGVIGLLLPTIGLPVMAEIVQAAATAAHKLGYLLMVTEASDDPDLALAYADELLARRVDGLLCYAAGDNENLAQRARDASVPLVELVRPSEPQSGQAVVIDYEVAMRAAFDDLQANGHTDIAIVARSHSRLIGQHIVERYRENLKRLGIRRDPALEYWSDSDEQCRQGLTLLLGRERPPTAIVLQGAPNWIGGVDMLIERGLRIPEDVSVITIGNRQWSPSGRSQLNSVSNEHGENARMATRLLVQHIVGDESAPRIVWAQASYTARGSVGPARPR